MQRTDQHHPCPPSSLLTEYIKEPLWDVAAKGPSAHPSNAAYAQDYIGSLLTAQFPNMTAQQVRGR
jgi:hypothetical protein